MQLKKLIFDRDYQALGMEGALWMMQNWRDMVCLEGTVKGVAEDDGIEKTEAVV